MTFETVIRDLPQQWLYAITYGVGETNFSDEEIEEFDNWETDFINAYGEFHVGDVEHRGFMKFHDASLYGVPACDVTRVSLLVSNSTH